MKTPLGALAIAALLVACSGQEGDTKTGVLQAGSPMADKPAAGRSSTGLAALSRSQPSIFANAPDRGELFTYDSKAGVKRQGAYTLRPVKLSEEHAFRGMASGLMTVPAPDGSQIKIRYERHEESPDGNWSWIGKVIGGEVAQEAIFTFGEKAVFGSIPQASGPALRLTTKNGVAYLMQADPSLLKRGLRKGGDVKTRIRSALEAQESDSALVAVARAKAGMLAAADVSTKAFTAANTIDLVVGYSNGFVTANGSASAAGTRLNFLVTVANQALLNSSVNARVRVVQALEVNYADGTDNGDALDQLSGHDGTTPSTPPAALLPLRTARDQYGADLVTLIRDFQPQNNGCGIAWQNGANGENITVAGDAPFGYSVVSDGDYDQAGNTYYCEDISLVHELAHNMGSAHDIANAAGKSGRYPYSYGYKTTASTGNFFTVMAYGDDNQQLYRLFSNPRLTTCGGLACGVANQADNALSLSQTIPIVSSFRATVVPNPQMLSNDYNGDGKSDLFWRNANTGANLIWRSADSNTQTAANSVATTWKVVATGDFNGDGKSDVFWRQPTTGSNVIWWSGAYADSTVVAAVGADWEVAGTGDFDADGKSDVFWRNSTAGQNVIWWAANSANYTVAATVVSNWKFVGAGDFNADGMSDILWRNSSGANVIWWSGSGAGAAAIDPVALPWEVAAVGDFDGDGKSDIFWRNPATGANVIWRSGTAAGYSVLMSVATNWKLTDAGDYNGDGKTDVLWRDSSSGSNVVWYAANSSTIGVLSTVSDQAWSVQP